MDPRLTLIATRTHIADLVAQAQRDRGSRPGRPRRAPRLRLRARTAASPAAGRPAAGCG
jgi:hypothetical protein